MQAVTAFDRFKARVVGVLPAPTARCWIFHKWGMWHQGAATPMLGPMGLTGLVMIQNRVCDRCNKVAMIVTKCRL